MPIETYSEPQTLTTWNKAVQEEKGLSGTVVLFQLLLLFLLLGNDNFK